MKLSSYAYKNIDIDEYLEIDWYAQVFVMTRIVNQIIKGIKIWEVTGEVIYACGRRIFSIQILSFTACVAWCSSLFKYVKSSSSQSLYPGQHYILHVLDIVLRIEFKLLHCALKQWPTQSIFM